jgi:hypothetical protein
MKGTGSADSTVNLTLPQWHEPSRCIALSLAFDGAMMMNLEKPAVRSITGGPGYP